MEGQGPDNYNTPDRAERTPSGPACKTVWCDRTILSHLAPALHRKETTGAEVLALIKRHEIIKRTA